MNEQMFERSTGKDKKEENPEYLSFCLFNQFNLTKLLLAVKIK